MVLFSDFVLACLIMGLGIGIDVAIATFMQGSVLSNKKMRITWILGVSATHTLFPMFGYLLTYFSVQALPVVTPLVGMVAFVLISIFIIDEIKSSNNIENKQSNGLINIALIFAVSWDALWSGPAKSAQVVGWSEWMIWLSFVIVGGVVTAFCLSSLYIAKKVCVLPLGSSPKHQHKILGISRWIQYSVLSYFGLLALVRYTFSSDISWVVVLFLSFFLMWFVLKAVSYRSVEPRKAFS